MFSNIINQVEVDKIIINRDVRQRSTLTPDSVLPLAVSIGTSQWISPILVDSETNYLIAGERRLTAVKALRDVVNGDYSSFSDQEAARIALFPVCSCKVDSWKQWTKIPAQLGKDFTPVDLAVYEFIENAHRQDLPWQDRAKAIYEIHAANVVQDSTWTAINTANLLGIAKSTVTENLRVWRVVANEDADAKLKAIIDESATIKSALQTLERHISRRDTGPGVTLTSTLAPRPKAETPISGTPGPKPNTISTHTAPSWLEDEYEEPLPLASDVLLNADFTTWAASYEGEPFNFIHCDFPYGINFNDGLYSTRPSSTSLNHYDDSPEVYWQLLNTLRDNIHLIAPQCHIMFWFSQNLRRETEDFFTALGGFVQPYLMIWHCGTNDGIVPDSQRYGRRTYETAMLITFGDRKIVVPRALSVDASRESTTRIHRSQKPLKVLSHFFEMFVDDSTIMLDPTAGSATSLIAAKDAKARRIVGLEVDPEVYKAACTLLNTQSTVKL